MKALMPAPALTIVTGGSGWFGRAFLNALEHRPEGMGPVGRDGVVRVLVASPTEVDAVLAELPRAQVHVGDIADEAVVARLFEGAENASVVHAAGVIHPRRVQDFERVNVRGTENVLAAAQRVGARRVVHISSNSPFGLNATSLDRFRHDEPYDPYMGYGHSKMLGELAVLRAREAGQEVVVIRPPWFYGPYQPVRQTTFLRMVRTGRFPILGDGRQRRSMVYVDHLVQGVALAERVPEAAGESLWVADARPYSVLEIVDAVKQALREEGLDVSAHQLRLPAFTGRVARGVDAALQGRGLYSSQFHVLGEMGATIACDIDRTRAVLGYEPEVDVHEGMRRSVRWCLAQGMEL